MAIFFYDRPFIFELLSNLVFSDLNQAASRSIRVTSTPSLNFTPLMTLAR